MMDDQLTRFLQGTEFHAYRFLGCHRELREEREGYAFRVWAPHAVRVSVVGSFNGWDPDALPMRQNGGIFEAFSEDVREADEYKYYIETTEGTCLWKADPYGFSSARLPETSSKVRTIEGYLWRDGPYRRAQARKKLMQNPINVYEVHAGSWRRKDNGDYCTFQELAETLIPYVQDMGYTHIAFLPLMEHSYYHGHGYEVTGYYAPSSRYGTPTELMAFVDACHAAGIGVLMDWVPGAFPKDEHGLAEFDGDFCYELQDPVMNEHFDAQLRIFDFGRPEVQSFLISNAVYWVEEYHLDGLRVGELASMLYLDYDRDVWTPNEEGGNLNLEARNLLRKVNETVTASRGNVIMAAEDSSAFPNLTTPSEEGGLGFHMKWCTDWTREMLRYAAHDPVYRKYHHDSLSASMEYIYSERFILPLSHGNMFRDGTSLIERMPGYYDDKFANLRTLYGFQIAHPGKKLNFMGNEFAQFAVWNAERPLDWFLLNYDRHRQMQQWVRDLNRFYLGTKAFWQNDSDEEGFRWIRKDDSDRSLIVFRRIDRKGKEVIVICNFCPVLWDHYRLGLPKKGCYLPVLCSDGLRYGGTGVNVEPVRTEPIPSDGLGQSAEFTVPPLSVTFYTLE